ncbi:unnamed protein product [Gordionus sp. m RMFG-2023]
MSFTPNLPVSYLIRSATQDDGNTRKSREEWKKLKELEEARKQGNVPAQTDEQGRDINPHIPQYIAQAPWYFGSATATLQHQREQEEKIKEYHKIDTWYQKGIISEKPKKFRKGACENCGSMTHKKKDCVERPRKIGAKFSKKDLAPDEVIIPPPLESDYDGKRDRWNGYDPSEYATVVKEFSKIEEVKKLIKAQKLESELTQINGTNEEEINDDKNAKETIINAVTLIADEIDEDLEDEDKYADSFDMPGTKHDSKQRITVRNLRIREDTAKYLYNLDLNSAFYDPKTRSMRANPFADAKSNPNELKYAGDNFIRYTGDTPNIAKQQLFAWEAIDKGIDVNQQSEPTKLELLYREFKEKREELKGDLRNTLYDKYGRQEDFEAPPVQLLLAQNESYIEYSRTGQVVKGQERAKLKSKYEEDVYIQNHTSVWGSFWYQQCWGYKCCNSFVKQSYCMGEKGLQLFKVNIVE